MPLVVAGLLVLALGSGVVLGRWGGGPDSGPTIIAGADAPPR